MPDERMQVEAGLKRALEWVSDHRRANPNTRLGAVIEEACRKFDLTPVQTDFLYRHFFPAPDRPAPPA